MMFDPPEIRDPAAAYACLMAFMHDLKLEPADRDDDGLHAIWRNADGEEFEVRAVQGRRRVWFEDPDGGRLVLKDTGNLLVRFLTRGL